MIRVLMVCMGNICRSPTAQGVFEQQVKEAGLSGYIQVDSAGTHAYHVGEPPDTRAQATAQQRGIDISIQRARRAIKADFDEFDYILAMDHDNQQILRELSSPENEHHLHLLLSFAPSLDEEEVPDPYYGGQVGFEHMFDLIEVAGQGLLTEIQERHF
ncbi:MAG: low molecular weight phosphotyrosine protein phosphatase [Gammaproteobacteria bacterium]|nr:low molecular weight phosphotyrosine protein phosphatase [Gammaproteobacteria bacterium]